MFLKLLDICFDGWREEDLSAGVLRELGENLVALAAAGGPVGADGVDDGFGALAHFDGFIEVDAALVVVAVGDEDHGFADRFLSARGIEQLVSAGGIDGVVHRGAAAGAEAIDAGFERIDVVGPVGVDVGSDVEAHHKGAIASGLENLKEELDCRLLFELEAGTDGGAGVDDDADTKRQIDLLAERGDFAGAF